MSSRKNIWMHKQRIVIILLYSVLVSIVNCSISANSSGVAVTFTGQGTSLSGIEIYWYGDVTSSVEIVDSDPYTYSPIVPLSYYTFIFNSNPSLSGSFVSPPLPPTSISVIFPRLASSVQATWTSAVFSGTFDAQPRTSNLISCPTCTVGYRTCLTLLGVTNIGGRYELNTTCTNHTLNTFSSSYSIPAAHGFHLDIWTYGNSNKGEYLSTRTRLIDGSSISTGPNFNITPVSAPNFPQFSFTFVSTNTFTIRFTDKTSTDAIRFTIVNVTLGTTSVLRSISYWVGQSAIIIDNTTFPNIKSSQRFELSAYHVLSFLNAVFERTSSTFLYTKPDTARNFTISSATTSSVLISFTHPSNRGDGYLYYSVSYNDKHNQQVTTIVDNINNLHGGTAVLNSNLRPNQLVTAVFTTVNRDYYNDLSSTVSFTAATLPHIDEFTVSSISTNSVGLNWNYTSNMVADFLSDELDFIVCVQAVDKYPTFVKCSSVITNYTTSYLFTMYDYIIQPSISYSANITFINRRLPQVRNSMSILFTTPPNAASDFKQIYGSTNSITVQWTETNSIASIETWYTICIEQTSQCKRVSVSNITALQNVTFDSLATNRAYTVSIVTQNQVGDTSGKLQYLSAITGLSAPLLVSIDFGADYAILAIGQKTPAFTQGIIISFTMVLSSINGNIMQALSFNGTTITVYELPAETAFRYSITPTAIWNSAIVKTTEVLTGTFTTSKGTLPTGVPQIFEIIQSASNEITVILQRIESTQTGNARIIEYQIEYTTDAFDFGQQQKVSAIQIVSTQFNTDQGSVIINNLSTGTTYLFRARGKNYIGFSPYSQITKIVTTSNPSSVDTNGSIATVVVIVVISMICVLIIISTILISATAIVFVILLRRAKRRNTSHVAMKKLMIEMEHKDGTFQINYNDLSFVDSKVLGSGAQGTVCSAKYKGAQVAVKMFSKNVMGVDKDLSAFVTEVKFLATHCNHMNIIRLIGVAEDRVKHKLCIITELCTGDNLANYVEKNKIDFLSKVLLLRGVASGMSYLHSNNIVHRDLKCENVLLDASSTVPKIIDFGLSRQIEDTNRTLNLTMNVGTPSYLAPEIIKLELQNSSAQQVSSSSHTSTKQLRSAAAMDASVVTNTNSSMTSMQKRLQYDIKADVYSFGIMMYVVYFENKNPYGTNVNDLQIMYHISQNINFRPKIVKEKIVNGTEWYIGLMKQCWHSDPEKRPSFAQIIQMIDTLLNF